MKDYCVNTGERCPREDLVVVDPVLPTDAKDSSKLRLPEPLYTFTTIQSSCLASVQKSGKGQGTVRERSVHSISRFNPVVKVLFCR